MIRSALCHLVADRQAIGKHGEFDIRKLARQMKAGRAGVEGDGHPFADPAQRVSGNIGFVGIMAFQACAKGFTAVAAVRVNQTRTPVLAQKFPLLL